MPDAEELNPHNLLSHLTHTQSICGRPTSDFPGSRVCVGVELQGETGERNIVDRTRVAG